VQALYFVVSDHQFVGTGAFYHSPAITYNYIKYQKDWLWISILATPLLFPTELSKAPNLLGYLYPKQKFILILPLTPAQGRQILNRRKTRPEPQYCVMPFKQINPIIILKQ
jgi:hypothetical protein